MGRKSAAMHFFRPVPGLFPDIPRSHGLRRGLLSCALRARRVRAYLLARNIYCRFQEELRAEDLRTEAVPPPNSKRPLSFQSRYAAAASIQLDLTGRNTLDGLWNPPILAWTA
jgi:hypothetical protein